MPKDGWKTLTISDKTYLKLSRMAKKQNTSLAGVVNQLLEGT